MRGIIWGLVTAAMGVTIIVLLVVDGVQYGIWIDEIGPSLDLQQQAAQPTIVTSAVIGLLALGLVVGGLVVGFAIPRGYRPQPSADS